MSEKKDKNESGSSTLISDVEEFYQLVSDELDACHPEAFDVIYKIVNQRPKDDELKVLLSDFNFEYTDELEGCNDEACENLKRILKKHKID